MEKDKFQSQIEKARLLTVISSMALGLVVVIAAIVLLSGPVYQWAGFDTYSITIVPFVPALLFVLASLFLGVISTNAAREEEEKELLIKKKNLEKTFEGTEDVRFTSGRALVNYKKYLPYVLSMTSALLLAFILYSVLRYWNVRVEKILPTNSIHVAFTSAIFMCACIFGGMFCIGQSKEKEFRWLRPVGAWLVLAAVSMLCAGIVALANKKAPYLDAYTAKTLFAVYSVLAIEFVIAFVTEFYRPRTSIESERPVFESRLLALFTEPGGVVRNIADTLDYQFGFKVSKTWIYTFVEKAIVPLIIIWLFSLWMLTCISEIGSNEVGMRERFGKLVSEKPIHAGVYFKLPWPFEKISRFAVYRVHEISIGLNLTNEKGEETRPEVVLWTKAHYAKESSFLVASDKSSSDSKDVPVSFLNASMPIQYQIRESELIKFAYKNENPLKTLKDLGESVATKYFASVDFLKAMSSDRHKISMEVRNLLQKEVDRYGLGIDILYVNLHDVHPPVEKVAPAFQDVIGAREEKETAILNAKAYQKTVIFDAEAQANKLVKDADTYKSNVLKLSKAESERFQKQLASYKQMPEMFRLRTYLDFLENDCKNIRKFIMSANMPYEVYEINMEEKARLDLIDANIGEIAK